MSEHFINRNVVVDTDTSYTYIGRFVRFEEANVFLEDVIIYDDETIRVPLEEYLIECASIGFSPSRKSVWLNRHKVISISLLEDIIVP